MDNTVEIKNLRADEPDKASTDGFWRNAPKTDGEYIIVPRIEGV